MKKFLLLALVIFSINAVAYNFYFANIHAHTAFSDGSSTPTDAYTYAKNYVDIQAITDHAYYFRQKIDNQDKLLLTKKMAEDATVEGKFVAMWGFEWTGGVGHINVYGTTDWTDRNESDLKNLYKWIVSHRALAQFNHPGVTYGNFYDFEYDLEADKYINLIEVGNGNTSRRTITKEMYSNYILALNKGWHVGATANQDNHRPNWGSANDTRTAILADALTYNSIMEALKQRRTYATEDKNAKILFKCNDFWMGSILKDATQLNFEIKLSDDEPFYEAVLVSQSGDVAKWRINSNEFSTSYRIVPPDGYEWYFLYVIQNDWDEIVTSPIWVQYGDVHVVNLHEKVSGRNVDVYFDLINTSNLPVHCDISVKISNVPARTEAELKAREIKQITVPLSNVESGIQTVEVFLNGFKAQTGTVEVKKGLIIVDQSHENTYESFWKTAQIDIENQGYQVEYSQRFFKKVPNASMVFLTLPSKDSFPELRMLNDFEIENLVEFYKKGGQIVLIALKNSLIEDSYNTLLEKMHIDAKLAQSEGNVFLFKNDKMLDFYEQDGFLFISCEEPSQLMKKLKGRLP
ncbi:MULTISPECIES: CehA/McbA family metallohydrolase [Pseudothermotoga]|uniref:PHP domain protein n=1 Tax=Pseudothermotoga lettingae (strain ATCC BAA-301 / DSM 14385 / NBRC 107922 / TMO) TaxID=416591 RepID=A8F7A5_PSELT|nr:MULTISPECIES: CehA/McbA family metallohydrolase [Pseudothermotoga]ABV34039.1 PHP domain protein [Pseudothermotoga lettingae TMO]MDI3494834.1 hypothetical protein [Pseudothermotoga sp.]GLI49022.1 hypothetical protein PLETTINGATMO_11910 [Pseudothermotoga lettingae TMO]